MARADMFLKIAGVTGESKDSKHPETIEIMSLSFGVHNASGVGGNTGSGTGKASFSEITVMKLADKCSTTLWQKCATGKHFATADIFIRRSTGDDASPDYEIINLTEVYVTSWSQSASDGGGMPQESLSFSYNTIVWDYKPQDDKGALGATTKKGYSITENKVKDS